MIPVGGRFTDIHLAVSDNPPDLAGIDATFTGNLVPEPAALTLMAIAFASLAIASVRRRRFDRTALFDDLLCNRERLGLHCAQSARPPRHFSAHRP